MKLRTLLSTSLIVCLSSCTVSEPQLAGASSRVGTSVTLEEVVLASVPDASSDEPASCISDAPVLGGVDAGVVADASALRSYICLTDEGDALTPDPVLTPGKLCTEKDPDFNGVRYGSVPVCRRRLSNAVKTQVAKNYGVRSENYSKFEFDHLVPLSLGGANSVANVWPQPLTFAQEKDKLEEKLYADLKAGRITQTQAVATIRAWRPAVCR